MALDRNEQDEEIARKNDYVVIEIYDIELNDGRVFYLTSNNGDVNYNNNTYRARPIDRDESSQEGTQSVGELQIRLGDVDNGLTKEILNNLSIVRNASVTINQQRQSIEGTVLLGFRQVFRGRIKQISGSLGVINFTVLAFLADPQKPVNDKKFGEFPGMIDVYRRIVS